MIGICVGDRAVCGTLPSMCSKRGVGEGGRKISEDNMKRLFMLWLDKRRGTFPLTPPPEGGRLKSVLLGVVWEFKDVLIKWREVQ